jgi:copper chaperone CopZ
MLDGSRIGRGRWAVREVRVRVRRMDCRHRVRELTAWLRDLPGVVMVSADTVTGEVTLTGTMGEADVVAAVAVLGYAAEVVDAGPGR